jgi:glycosyltransferase involved in cell wall biosynthesis
MKLIIQIPCYNEAQTLAIALAELPRHVPGFEEVQWLVVDDGSSDDTARVAREAGVDHVVVHAVNRGLATAFMTGLNACLKLGADVIVNTDADNQYNAHDIPCLTSPVLAGRADMVVGARPISDTEHFSWVKKKLQRLGSWAVRVASKTRVEDAPSGFRAISRDAAMRLNVFNNYTYTLETIIQAGLSNLRVLSVPIRTNPDLRPSRLVKSNLNYVMRSLATILRVFVIYRPLVLFFSLASVFGLAGVIAGGRFVFFYFTDGGGGHVQSVVFSALCLILAAVLALMGVVGELVATNRKLLESLKYQVRQLQHTKLD